jgi:hypothetical protein
LMMVLLVLCCKLNKYLEYMAISAQLALMCGLSMSLTTVWQRLPHEVLLIVD